MLLIADGGSTKTDWCYIDCNKKRIHFQSKGMNPYNITLENLMNEMEFNVVKNLEGKEVTQLYFYGSGCSKPQKQKEMKDVFKRYFHNADIFVAEDLLGAARATCGHEKGLAAILGTGSNSCLYDGEKITENIPSLGYVLCDEGAGTNIGKLVLRNYLRHQMPKNLNDEFAKEYPGEESDFLNRLYKGEVPNYYLASFAKFVIQRQKMDYCRNIIKEVFNNFFSMQITQYTNYNSQPINVVGSVGYYAQEVFKEVAKDYKMQVNRIIKAPMEELINYHLG